MNEEELKEAIEILKNGLDNPKVKSENCFYFDEYQMNTIKNMTYTLEKELAQEKEKNKKLEEELEESKSSFREQVEIANNYFTMNKVIDLMAEDLVGACLSCPADCKDFDMDKNNCDEKCKDGIEKDCFKEYYFKVAKGEEYKNKYCGGED